MKRILVATIAATFASFAGIAAAAPSNAVGPAPTVDVMTQNQYLGADIAPLIAAIGEGPEAFNAAVIKALMQIAANQTPARVRMLSEQILARRPHLVGLQEVWEFACFPDSQAKVNHCDNPMVKGAFSNHLALTESALAGNYVLKGVVQNFTATVPFSFDGVNLAYLSVKDRDVIFARSDVTATPFKQYPCSKPSQDGCNFEIDLPLGALGSVKRGFVMVDAEIAGEPNRFVNTHLEVEGGGPIPGEVQAAQAIQLTQTVLGATPADRRLIVVGDMNSSPNDAPSSLPTPYQIFYAAGLADAWLLRPGDVAGLTCCQLEDLSNRVSVLVRRIDLILTREVPPRVKDARVIGEVAADRLAPPGRGLWPSDHASVAAGLQY